VILPSAVRDAVVAHAREEAPRECCGILIGANDAIVAAVRAANLTANPETRFLIDPRDHIRARREARAAGLEVVGFYHSHPHSDAVPSATDVAEALYADHLYLIVGLAAGAADVRLYKFNDARFEAIGFRT